MRIEVSKEWCARMADLEGDSEIGAGRLAIDPSPCDDEERFPEAMAANDDRPVAFGRLVELIRRERRLSADQLADQADVDVAEVVAVEENAHHKPDLRTVHQLANFFGLPRDKLLQLAGLTAARDEALLGEAVRFAARAEPVAELEPHERAALEAFVSVLSGRPG